MKFLSICFECSEWCTTFLVSCQTDITTLLGDTNYSAHTESVFLLNNQWWTFRGICLNSNNLKRSIDNLFIHSPLKRFSQNQKQPHTLHSYVDVFCFLIPFIYFWLIIFTWSSLQIGSAETRFLIFDSQKDWPATTLATSGFRHALSLDCSLPQTNLFQSLCGSFHSVKKPTT